MISFLLYILVGAIAGLMAGLLGLGGGVVIVPGLVSVFSYADMPRQAIMHMATSTSLAVMIITTLTAVISQQRRRTILWSVFRQLVPGTILGTICGVTLATVLSTHTLKLIFGVFLLLMAIRLLLAHEIPANTSETPPFKPIIMGFAGFIVGLMSGLLGIGGGVVAIPLLLRLGVPMHNAAATSSACALLLSVVGTLVFMLEGWHVANLPSGSFGYVYLPAVLSIAAASVCVVPVAVRLAHYLSARVLKSVFALMLIPIGLDMLLR